MTRPTSPPTAPGPPPPSSSLAVPGTSSSQRERELGDAELEELRVLLMEVGHEVWLPFVAFGAFMVGGFKLIIDISPVNAGLVMAAVMVSCTAVLLPSMMLRHRRLVRRARELGLDDAGLDAVRRAVRMARLRSSTTDHDPSARSLSEARIRAEMREELGRSRP